MNQSILEVRHLRTLVTLRDSGSLVRAAQLLNLTQSALSHQIKLLEDRYGQPLFERKSVPPQFTAVGERLLALADAVLPQVEGAERDIARLVLGQGGQMRIAVECHTCFDWLMPAMDRFRAHWPEVELDIVSGFHADPVQLLFEERADLAIVSEPEDDAALYCQPLFAYDMVALIANDHPLAAKAWLDAEDFSIETLITYPVPDEMLDLLRKVLKPAGINPKRRTTELTVAMLQLVASKRGIAALPRWSVQGYLDKGYVTARPVTQQGLRSELYAAIPAAHAQLAYMQDFLLLMREVSAENLPGVSLLSA